MARGPYDFWEPAQEESKFEPPMFHNLGFVFGWMGLEMGHKMFNSRKAIMTSLDTAIGLPADARGAAFRNYHRQPAHGPGGFQTGASSPNPHYSPRGDAYRSMRDAGRTGRGHANLNARDAVNRTMRSPALMNQAAGGGALPGGIRGEIQSHHQVRAKYGAQFATRTSVWRNFKAMSRMVWISASLELGFFAGTMIAKSIADYEPGLKKYHRRDIELGEEFVDTRSAQTQRARAIQAIHNSHLSTRAVLGNEASMMHYR